MGGGDAIDRPIDRLDLRRAGWWRIVAAVIGSLIVLAVLSAIGRAGNKV
jgi:hypothetical protein